MTKQEKDQLQGVKNGLDYLSLVFDVTQSIEKKHGLASAGYIEFLKHRAADCRRHSSTIGRILRGKVK